MRTPIAFLTVAALAVSSCGWQDSRVNPRNWFGSSQEVELNTEAQAAVNPLIPESETSSIFTRAEAPDESVLISSVTSLRIDRTSTGAIIYAEGLAARQGAYNVRLLADTDAPDGTLALQFRAEYPASPTPEGSVTTRTLRAAYSLSNGDLDEIRTIRVTADTNAQETRR